MDRSKQVLVVHPDVKARSLLQSILESQGYHVSTDQGSGELVLGETTLLPDVILVDRSLLAHQGIDLLSTLSRKWEDAKSVILPEGLLREEGSPATLSSVLRIVERLLQLKPTRELLAV